jgi:hypothetical protein
MMAAETPFDWEGVSWKLSSTVVMHEIEVLRGL